MKRLLVVLLLLASPALADQYIRPVNDSTNDWDTCDVCSPVACLGDNNDDTKCQTDEATPGSLMDCDVDTNGVDPGVDTDHYVYARCLVLTGNGTPFIRVIVEDATNGDIADSGEVAVSATSLTTILLDTLSEAEAANITSYTTLDLEIYGGSSGTKDVQCSEVWLQIPSAAGGARRMFLAN